MPLLKSATESKTTDPEAVKALKRKVNLLSLIGSNVSLHKVARTGGGEYAGPCPFCGGTNRFRVQP